MKKSGIINTLIWMLLLQTSVSSCTKWLDVKPADKTLEADIFSSRTGIYKALNGIYSSLDSSSLYGQALTKSVIDVMAQYYNAQNIPYNNHQFIRILKFGYTAIESQTYFSNSWGSAYKSILSINNFLEATGKYKMPLPPVEATLLKGECYGLRAFLHFDLLRLFGPVYITDSLLPAIPYKTTTDVGLQPLLGANKVMELILQDLKMAESLLHADPVILSGVKDTGTMGDDAFYRYRNRRMNYYAVLALEARVYLYQNNKPAAAAAAEKVIAEAAKWFPWGADQAFIGVDADRIFSSEILFGLYDGNMYNSQLALFDASANDVQILAPARTPDVSKDIYESNGQDFRYIANWANLTGSRTSAPFSMLFVKYEDVTTKSITWRNFQPLIRMSELYYILAECKKDISYLNTVRRHRGLTELPPSAVPDQELLKEYRKEFMGEGQLFFYYKRNNLSSIKAFQLSSIAMGPAQYVVPLPNSETSQR